MGGRVKTHGCPGKYFKDFKGMFSVQSVANWEQCNDKVRQFISLFELQ